VSIELDTTPYWRPNQDVVYLEFMLAPSTIQSVSDLASRYKALPAGSYFDIAQIDFVTTGTPAPSVAITDFTPKRGRLGDIVTILGSGFAVPSNQNVVSFDGVPATVVSGDSSTLVVKANGSGPSVISVLGPGGVTAVSSQPFAFLYPPRSFTKLSGDNQSGPIGAVLQPFSAQIVDMDGQGLPGLTVAWQVLSGAGALSVSQSVTDDNGMASAVLTLGQTPGPVVVQAMCSGYGLRPLVFSLTATATTP
jgi:IPT/TIG domain